MPEIRKSTDETYELRLTAAEFRTLMSACGSAPADNGPKSHLYDAMWEAKIAADNSIPGPLKAGDRVRILEDGHQRANVRVGDILTVGAVYGERFVTNAPNPWWPADNATWGFVITDEGIGWERAG